MPRTQLGFEAQRLQNMARAEAAREATQLEAAKRAAQRSKRVAGLIMNPEKLEAQKRVRAQEASAKLRNEREAAKAAQEAELLGKQIDVNDSFVAAGMSRPHAGRSI